MANYCVEIQRQNVTLAQFLDDVRMECELKGIIAEIDQEEFENPSSEGSYGYSVINGKKECFSIEPQMVMKVRRKMRSRKTKNGTIKQYPTDKFERYEAKELRRRDWIENSTSAPCKSEICRTFPYDIQTLVLNWDDSMYNEICEFTFDDGETGHGYYYQENRD